MSHSLTPCEFDFLGDLCQDDHQIWEIFGFVRRHHKSLSEQEVFQLGQKLLLDWFQRGWIRVVDRKPNGYDKINWGDLTKLFEEIGAAATHQFDSTWWVEITAKGKEIYKSSKPTELNS
jgi:hypothetical protein